MHLTDPIEKGAAAQYRESSEKVESSVLAKYEMNQAEE